MKAQTRRILFTLAGTVLGMLAGAGFGMGKGIVAGAAFFGFVGFGLGYALHDFNWKRNRKTAAALALAFFAPLVALAWLMASQGFEKAVFTSESLFQVAGVWLALGGLLALVIYAAANTFGLIEEARGWPSSGVMGEDFSEAEESTDRFFDDYYYDTVYSDLTSNINHSASN